MSTCPIGAPLGVDFDLTQGYEIAYDQCRKLFTMLLNFDVPVPRTVVVHSKRLVQFRYEDVKIMLSDTGFLPTDSAESLLRLFNSNALTLDITLSCVDGVMTADNICVEDIALLA